MTKAAHLAAVEKLVEPALVVFKDFDPYLNDAAVIRRRASWRAPSRARLPP